MSDPQTTSPTTTAPRPDLAVDANGYLDADMTCIRCEYNLRGSDPEGRCPECGLAVGRSTRGHWLCYCDPTWVRTVWCGYNYLGLLVVMVGAFFGLAYVGFLKWMTREGFDMLGLFFFLLVICSLGVFGLFGLWRIGTPDPDRLEKESILHKRPLTRLSPLLLPCAWAVGFAYARLAPALGLVDQYYANSAGLTLAMFSFLLVPAITLWYAQSLAARIPARWLRRTTWCALFLMLSSTGSLHLIEANYFDWIGELSNWLNNLGYQYISPSAYLYVGAVRGNAWLGQPLRWLSIYAMIASLALMVGLFIWYWRAMKKQADLAKATWAAVPGAGAGSGPGDAAE